ncbi:hypothetical protein ACWD6O_13620 [Streptomyces californicus]
MITLVLGLLIVAGLGGLLMLGWNLRRQMEALRAEIAVARLEGALKEGPIP